MTAPERETQARPAEAEQLEQLRFLHEVARLATTARTWDELLETVVDGTRDALHADVTSLYLLDRDGAYLTLAATNGLDRFQIGRAKVPYGEGVTGHVAKTREPLVVPDVAAEKRFLWVRGIDQRRFVASMLSVPLSWNDQVVGVLNVQTEEHRAFTPADAAQLGAIGDLLAGIVEKGRQQAEAEARLAEMRRIDEARGELIALVTHELRTPLAVVRAYTELLAEDPPLEEGRESRDPARRAQRNAWHDASLAQVERLDRLVDSILQSVRIVPDVPAAVEPTDVEAAIREVVASVGPLVRQHNLDIQPGVGQHALADAAAPPPDPRAPHRERREVRPAGDDDHDRPHARRGLGPDRRHRPGPRRPRGVAGADLRALRPARHPHGPRLRDRAVRRETARRIDGRAAAGASRSTRPVPASSSPSRQQQRCNVE